MAHCHAEIAGAGFAGLTAAAALETTARGTAEDDTYATMSRINAIIESWIRERPEQWLWLHHRWPD